MSHDVVIAGGGPAGALAALILARAGARVAVIERARVPRPKLCGDTLNPGALAILRRYVDLAPLAARSRQVHGMILTGPGPVVVRGGYGTGRHGLCVTRDVLDQWLIEQAAAAGAHLVDGTTVAGPRRDAATGEVTGVVARGMRGGERVYPARVTIGADGRRSRLALACGLSRLAPWPRRWAVGAYFEGVDGLTDAGEMHVRPGHYLGVAPAPGGRTNVCLVQPFDNGERCPDPGGLLEYRVAHDALLAPRFRDARRVTTPEVLGPMAVDTAVPGCAGLLLAGDAAGFVDPITGDGIRLALTGAELAAAVAMDVLDGRTPSAGAAARLARLRRASLGRKHAGNRVLRRLVASPRLIATAVAAATVWPSAFGALIRYAGDCSIEE